MGLNWCKSRRQRTTREQNINDLIKSRNDLQQLAKQLESLIKRAKDSDPTHAQDYKAIKELELRLSLAQQAIPKLDDRLILLQSPAEYTTVMTKALKVAETVSLKTEQDTDGLEDLRASFQDLVDREQEMETTEDDTGSDLDMRIPVHRPSSRNSTVSKSITESTSLLDDAPCPPITPAKPTKSLVEVFDLA